MKKIGILLLLVTSLGYSQKKRSTKVGLTTMQELEMVSYERDTTANALVLYEHANTYLSQKHDLNFRTDYYFRVKLFDKKAYNKSNVKIRLYKEEKTIAIEAYSYNLENGVVKKTQLTSQDIFTKEISKNWKEVVFTIPNIREGTVIEYKYSVISPYSFLDDWYFQSDIPKLKSDLSTSYLGNYKYNIRLIGYLKLDRNEKKVEKKCLHVPRVGRGDCANALYGIDNIPAFKEEDYMLSKENFLSRISFELVSIARTDGSIRKFTKTWKDVDRSFKNDFLDNQTSKKKFFAKRLPKSLVSIKDELKKAKNIYRYIQDRFTWNKRFWTQDRIKIEEVFRERKGGVDAINLSLYNSLQAANIESYIVMIATRGKAQPTRLYPIRTDFNYVLVKAVINKKTYFLDATDKFLFFGQIPVRCLNGEGRVLNFKKESSWQKIAPILNTSSKIRASIRLNDKNQFTGVITVEKNGYHAKENRLKLSLTSKENYMASIETSTDFEVEDYTFRNLNKPEEPFFEIIKFKSDSIDSSANSIRLTPFLYHKINENPFKLEKRSYPIDFGYPRTYTYTINIDVPKGYKIKKMPEQLGFKLPNNGGMFNLKVSEGNNKVMVHYRYQIRKKMYASEEYHFLKEFYNEIIQAQSSYIEFEKIN
jgi:hypothetical protein